LNYKLFAREEDFGYLQFCINGQGERDQALDLGPCGDLWGMVYLGTKGESSRSLLMMGGSFSMV
jgi:hypothetical protein